MLPFAIAAAKTDRIKLSSHKKFPFPELESRSMFENITETLTRPAFITSIRSKSLSSTFHVDISNTISTSPSPTSNDIDQSCRQSTASSLLNDTVDTELNGNSVKPNKNSKIKYQASKVVDSVGIMQSSPNYKTESLSSQNLLGPIQKQTQEQELNMLRKETLHVGVDIPSYVDNATSSVLNNNVAKLIEDSIDSGLAEVYLSESDAISVEIDNVIKNLYSVLFEEANPNIYSPENGLKTLVPKHLAKSQIYVNEIIDDILDDVVKIATERMKRRSTIISKCESIGLNIPEITFNVPLSLESSSQNVQTAEQNYLLNHSEKENAPDGHVADSYLSCAKFTKNTGLAIESVIINIEPNDNTDCLTSIIQPDLVMSDREEMQVDDYFDLNQNEDDVIPDVSPAVYLVEEFERTLFDKILPDVTSHSDIVQLDTCTVRPEDYPDIIQEILNKEDQSEETVDPEVLTSCLLPVGTNPNCENIVQQEVVVPYNAVVDYNYLLDYVSQFKFKTDANATPVAHTTSYSIELEKTCTEQQDDVANVSTAANGDKCECILNICVDKGQSKVETEQILQPDYSEKDGLHINGVSQHDLNDAQQSKILLQALEQMMEDNQRMAYCPVENKKTDSKETILGTNSSKSSSATLGIVEDSLELGIGSYSALPNNLVKPSISDYLNNILMISQENVSNAIGIIDENDLEEGDFFSIFRDANGNILPGDETISRDDKRVLEYYSKIAESYAGSSSGTAHRDSILDGNYKPISFMRSPIHMPRILEAVSEHSDSESDSGHICNPIAGTSKDTDHAFKFPTAVEINKDKSENPDFKTALIQKVIHKNSFEAKAPDIYFQQECIMVHTTPTKKVNGDSTMSFINNDHLDYFSDENTSYMNADIRRGMFETINSNDSNHSVRSFSMTERTSNSEGMEEFETFTKPFYNGVNYEQCFPEEVRMLNSSSIEMNQSNLTDGMIEDVNIPIASVSDSSSSEVYQVTYNDNSDKTQGSASTSEVFPNSTDESYSWKESSFEEHDDDSDSSNSNDINITNPKSENLPTDNNIDGYQNPVNLLANIINLEDNATDGGGDTYSTPSGNTLWPSNCYQTIPMSLVIHSSSMSVCATQSFASEQENLEAVPTVKDMDSMNNNIEIEFNFENFTDDLELEPFNSSDINNSPTNQAKEEIATTTPPENKTTIKDIAVFGIYLAIFGIMIAALRMSPPSCSTDF